MYTGWGTNIDMLYIFFVIPPCIPYFVRETSTVLPELLGPVKLNVLQIKMERAVKCTLPAAGMKTQCDRLDRTVEYTMSYVQARLNLYLVI